MPLRVLHIFPPSLRTRFGGQNITWKYNFSKWSDTSIIHLVLDNEQNRIVSPEEAFDFIYPDKQTSTSTLGRLLWIPILLRNLRRKKNEYDILHFHILWWGSLLAAHWAQRNGIPSLYESVLLDADTPGSIGQENLGSIKLNLLKSFTGIIAISPFLKTDYLANGFTEDRVFLLINSVDSDLFCPIGGPEDKQNLREKLNLPVDDILLLFVGSVIHRKGFDILLRSFGNVLDKFRQCRLLVVGPANRNENPSLDESFIKYQRDWLEVRKIESKVTFLGLVNDRIKLAKIYQAADIFVFPSRVEGLGNVVLEAMASGLPIVVSDLPVLRGVIENRVNGLIVALEDADATAEAINFLIENPEIAQSYASRARGDVQTKFSFVNWEKNLVKIYFQLLELAKS